MVTSHIPVVEPQANDENADDLTRDEIFTMLSNRRRRWVLHVLKQSEEQEVDLRTLVDRISSWEYDTPADELPWKKRKRVYTALRQSHLPKLAKAGVIEYDQNQGKVTLTDEAYELQLYLEYVPARDLPWSQCYLGLSAVAVTLTILRWYSVYPFTELSGTVLAIVLVTMFTASAVIHTYHTHQHRLRAGWRAL